MALNLEPSSENFSVASQEGERVLTTDFSLD